MVLHSAVHLKHDRNSEIREREVQTLFSHLCTADQSQREVKVNVESSVLESYKNGRTQTPSPNSRLERCPQSRSHRLTSNWSVSPPGLYRSIICSVLESAHPSDPHSPCSSVCRYFPVRSESSPAPGRESSECFRPPAASPRSPRANWRHRESVNVSQAEQKAAACQVYVQVSVPGSAGALSALCCRWGGSAQSRRRWKEAAGRRPAGHGSSSGPSSASSPRQSLCAPPARSDPFDQPFHKTG